MKINAAGLALIKAHEGLRVNAYRDPVGIWTIGYGHTSAAGAPHVKPGMRITEAEADAILRRDLAKFERAVMDAIDIPLNENQFAALVSFCFNVGEGNFRKSSVRRYINDRKFDGVPGRLALWNKGGGRVLKGLVRRRREEGELFMTPVAPQEPVEPPAPVPPVSVPPKPVPPVRGPQTPKKPLTKWQAFWLSVTGAAAWASAWIADNAELVMGGLAVAVVGAVAWVVWRRRK